MVNKTPSRASRGTKVSKASRYNYTSLLVFTYMYKSLSYEVHRYDQTVFAKQLNLKMYTIVTTESNR